MTSSAQQNKINTLFPTHLLNHPHPILTRMKGKHPPKLFPQSGNWLPSGVYAIPYRLCLRASFFVNWLGSFGSEFVGLLLEEEEDEVLFLEATETPTPTPMPMRARRPIMEPAICGGGCRCGDVDVDGWVRVCGGGMRSCVARMALTTGGQGTFIMMNSMMGGE